MIHEYTEPGVNITFNDELGSLVINGEMRHASLTEFKPTKTFLWGLIKKIQGLKELFIDIHQLEYLNSSGQAILNMLILELKRETLTTSIKIQGTSRYEWQEKFLHTSKQLWGNAQSQMTIETVE